MKSIAYICAQPGPNNVGICGGTLERVPTEWDEEGHPKAGVFRCSNGHEFGVWLDGGLLDLSTFEPGDNVDFTIYTDPLGSPRVDASDVTWSPTGGPRTVWGPPE